MQDPILSSSKTLPTWAIPYTGKPKKCECGELIIAHFAVEVSCRFGQEYLKNRTRPVRPQTIRVCAHCLQEEARTRTIIHLN